MLYPNYVLWETWRQREPDIPWYEKVGTFFDSYGIAILLTD